MMYWGNDMGGWGIVAMTMASLLLWALVIAGVVVLVRYLGRVGQASARTGYRPAPEQLLADRFVRGEIDEDEYTRRLEVLNAAGSHEAPG